MARRPAGDPPARATRHVDHEYRERTADDRERDKIPSTLTVAKWGSSCLLLGIGLFWAVGSYALRMGSQDARGYPAGLKLVPQAGENYLLLPGDWQRGHSAFLMKPADTVRLEFVVAARPPAGC
jgi:hypothetical protein